MKETLIVPRGMVPLVNAEAARTGEATLAVNIREGDQSLQVTGTPRPAGDIGAGERLLLIVGEHVVTTLGDRVKIDGETVIEEAVGIVGAHAIGEIIVVVTRGGLIFLFPSQGGRWNRLNPQDAVPQLSFGTSMSTAISTIPAYTFAEPYSQWHEPLADVDTAAIAGMLFSAWRVMQSDLAAEGRHIAPMLVRWAVRLQDDTYLWVSDAVRVGNATLNNAERISALVESGSAFTGIESTTLPMSHYALAINVTRDISAEWLPLVKSIDVFVTDEAQLLNDSHRLDYRCLTRTSSTREYVLEMGLSRRSPEAITDQLNASKWHLVATAPASAHLSGNDFVTPVEPMTLTAGECSVLGNGMSLDGVVCSAAAGGRLYCCAGGDIVVSAAGNTLVEEHRRRVLGANAIAMAVATRPLYSSGFGRYPVYVFSDDGIYAIPQSPTGRLGEARLVDRMVIAHDVAPVEAADGIWFVSRHGHLCRLEGSRMTIMQHGVPYTALAWCSAYQELWMLSPDDSPVVRMASGTLSRRTVDAVQLYSDARHAVAVTASGTVLDLERENPAQQEVAWCSHPVGVDVLMARAVRRVVWHVKGGDVALNLKVVAQRSILSQEIEASTTTVAGEAGQPLATPVMGIRARTIRLEVTGSASSGTLLMPVLVYIH